MGNNHFAWVWDGDGWRACGPGEQLEAFGARR